MSGRFCRASAVSGSSVALSQACLQESGWLIGWGHQPWQSVFSSSLPRSHSASRLPGLEIGSGRVRASDGGLPTFA